MTSKPERSPTLNVTPRDNDSACSSKPHTFPGGADTPSCVDALFMRHAPLQSSATWFARSARVRACVFVWSVEKTARVTRF